MQRVPLQRKVLNENDRIAEGLRARFREHGVLCLNLISSPGSGKTSLLERTLGSFGSQERVAVLTGDIRTDNDAARLKRFGFPVKQITTGGTCHLDARMIERHLADWPLENLNVLFVENVGNLVCPASYDLGEAAKIVLLSHFYPVARPRAVLYPYPASGKFTDVGIAPFLSDCHHINARHNFLN